MIVFEIVLVIEFIMFVFFFDYVGMKSGLDVLILMSECDVDIVFVYFGKVKIRVE